MSVLITAPAGQAVADLGDLAERINQAHQRCEAALRSGLQHALECGRLLSQAKSQLAHGEWLPWLCNNCEVTPRAAQGYMRVASRWPELAQNAKRVSHLPYRQALAMLAAPKGDEHEPDADTPPDLSSGLAYQASGTDGEIIRIVPSTEFPGYHYVAVFRNVDSADDAEIAFVKRPCKIDGKVLTLPIVLKACEVKPAGPWSSYTPSQEPEHGGEGVLIHWLVKNDAECARFDGALQATVDMFVRQHPGYGWAQIRRDIRAWIDRLGEKMQEVAAQ